MKLRHLLIIQVIIFFAYICCALFFSVATDFLSPIHNFLAASIIFMAVQKMKTSKLNWILIVLMIGFWGIGELIYLITIDKGYFLTIEMPSVMIMMIISSVFMLLTIVVYFVHRLSKWNRLQLMLDVSMMSVVVLGIGSGVYLSKINILLVEPYQLVTMMMILSIDLISLLLLFSMIASIRAIKLDKIALMTTIAFLIHIVADLIDGYGFFNHNESVIVLTDILVLMSFNLFTLTSLKKLNYESSLNDSLNAAHHKMILKRRAELEQEKLTVEKPENMGKARFIIGVAILPLILYLAGAIDDHHFIVIMFAIILYLIFNSIIQKSITSELLLDQETKMKKKLENIVLDRTAELVVANKQLEIESKTDSLTGLYNRKYFLDVINNKIKEEQEPFSIFFIDLDRFKVINDIHGHIMGDQVLKVIAKRFSDRQCDHCRFARFGGDEFAVIYNSVDLKELEETGNRISQYINEIIHIDDYEFKLDASIGVARYPEDAKSAKELLKYADIAMYHAKNQEQVGKYVIHSDHFAEKVERRNYVELLLKDAQFSDFELYYQPQFSGNDEKLIGMEALVRWNHGLEGFISPAEFIPIAEEMGVIKTLSDWVFDTGIRQIKKWNETYDTNLVMSLNISPASLDSVVFLPNLIELFEETNIKPEWVGFEITEHSAMTTVTQMKEFLTSLSKMGVQISIDDFGTGYSSLSYLKRFDVDVIKIAKELIDNIVNDEDERLIVKAIIMMAEGMKIQTLAEGVETKEQLQLLKDLGCDKIQGYILGKPQSRDEFEEIYFN